VNEDYEFLSSLEKKVYDWLARNNIPFSTQVPMFGARREVGGATVDFVLPDRNIAIRCMGTYWHSGFESKARDLLGKERLLGQGFVVVDIWEETVTDSRIQDTMTKALLGEEALR
jgi:very-short-patch-repair endonuclease